MRNVSLGNDSIPSLARNVPMDCPLGLKTTENVPDWAMAAGVVAAGSQRNQRGDRGVHGIHDHPGGELRPVLEDALADGVLPVADVGPGGVDEAQVAHVGRIEEDAAVVLARPGIGSGEHQRIAQRVGGTEGANAPHHPLPPAEGQGRQNPDEGDDDKHLDQCEPRAWTPCDLSGTEARHDIHYRIPEDPISRREFAPSGNAHDSPATC